MVFQSWRSEGFRTLVDAAVRRPGHIVMRISQTKAHTRLRKQREVDVAHASRRIK